jgi:hypothetical protein
MRSIILIALGVILGVVASASPVARRLKVLLDAAKDRIVGSVHADSQAALHLERARSSILLDSFSGATVAWSTRKLRSEYARAAVLVRRSSDNAEQDIGFSQEGDFDAAAFMKFVGEGDGFVHIWYDQSGNDVSLRQETASKQYQIILNGTNAVLRGNMSSGMCAADAAVYKTTVVDAFVVARLGSRNIGQGFAGGFIVGYPRTPSSNVQDNDWAFSTSSNQLIFQVYAPGGYLHNTVNPEGFAAAFRNQLFQYELNTREQSIRNNTHVFFPARTYGAFTVLYPYPVGLCVGIDATGENSFQDGDIAEVVLYGATQAARDAISKNQSTYWSISDPPAAVATSDGFTWAPSYQGDWHAPIIINGRPYAVESAFDLYSVWTASNVSNGAPLIRFEVHQADLNQAGGERSEFDGAAGPAWPVDTTVQISYSVMVEPGTSYRSSWNTLGQFHYSNFGYPPASMSLNLQNDFWSVQMDGTVNPITVFVAPHHITRGSWDNIFIEQKISSNGKADILKVWINAIQVLNLSGSLFPHGKRPGYWKFGVYRGDVVSTPIAVRYANMEIVDKSVTDLTSRITSPLTVPVHP